MKVHPDQEHLIFAIGNKISVLNIKTNKQVFLSGHTHNISTLEVSPSGRLVASGQINHMGFRAHLIVWDWQKKCEILRHELHKVRVQDLCFSSDEEHIISLGGKDCGMIIVWNIRKKFVNRTSVSFLRNLIMIVSRSLAVCGQMAARETTGAAAIIGGLHRRSRVFITGGDRELIIDYIEF